MGKKNEDIDRLSKANKDSELLCCLSNINIIEC